MICAVTSPQRWGFVNSARLAASPSRGTRYRRYPASPSASKVARMCFNSS